MKVYGTVPLPHAGDAKKLDLAPSDLRRTRFSTRECLVASNSEPHHGAGTAHAKY